MILPVLTYPHPVLKKKAVPVEKITPALKELAEAMLETMYEYEGVGLAAPQVGESLRMIVMDVEWAEGERSPHVFINPELELLDEEIDSEEGCLSVKEYRSTVKRCPRVRMKALDLEGRELELEAEGLFAICLQHECDHLEGKLFIDKISRLKRNLYDSKVRKWQKTE